MDTDVRESQTVYLLAEAEVPEGVWLRFYDFVLSRGLGDPERLARYIDPGLKGEYEYLGKDLRIQITSSVDFRSILIHADDIQTFLYRYYRLRRIM